MEAPPGEIGGNIICSFRIHFRFFYILTLNVLSCFDGTNIGKYIEVEIKNNTNAMLVNTKTEVPGSFFCIWTLFSIKTDTAPVWVEVGPNVKLPKRNLTCLWAQAKNTASAIVHKCQCRRCDSVHFHEENENNYNLTLSLFLDSGILLAWCISSWQPERRFCDDLMRFTLRSTLRIQQTNA